MIKAIHYWAEASGPIELTKALEYFDLYHLAKPCEYFYPLNGTQTRRLFLDKSFDESLLSDFMYGTHIWNHAFGKTSLYQSGSKNQDSLLQYLIDRYHAYIQVLINIRVFTNLLNFPHRFWV